MSPTVRSLGPSFRRHLLASNRSARTVQTYLCAVGSLARYLESGQSPVEIRRIRPRHVEAFAADPRCRRTQRLCSGFMSIIRMRLAASPVSASSWMALTVPRA